MLVKGRSNFYVFGCSLCWGKRGTQEAENFIRTYMHTYIHTYIVCTFMQTFIYLFVCLFWTGKAENLCALSDRVAKFCTQSNFPPLNHKHFFISAVYSQVLEKFSADVHKIATGS